MYVCANKDLHSSQVLAAFVMRVNISLTWEILPVVSVLQELFMTFHRVASLSLLAWSVIRGRSQRKALQLAHRVLQIPILHRTVQI